MTSDVNLNTITGGIQKTSDGKATLNQDYTQFLKLLTTQLQNQDPLNPMDSSQFTNQLVMFSEVEQQINANQKLDSLNTLALSNVTSAALGYVGLDINYESSEMNFDGTTPVTINYALSKSAAQSQINILNADGNVVYSTTGAVDTARHTFTWNGQTNDGLTVKPGTYTIQVAAIDGNNQSVTSTTVVSGLVHGIETQNGVINLLVGDRAVPVGNVLNAFQPGTSSDTVDTSANDNTNSGSG